MRETVETLKCENERLNTENTDMKGRLDNLELKTDDLECRSKRNNVIFYGLPRTDSMRAHRTVRT